MEFLNQMRLFPTVTNDDGPDALQGAIQALQTIRYQSPGTRRNPERRNPQKLRQR